VLLPLQGRVQESERQARARWQVVSVLPGLAALPHLAPAGSALQGLALLESALRGLAPRASALPASARRWLPRRRALRWQRRRAS
jgi:hypothetical protein